MKYLCLAMLIALSIPCFSQKKNKIKVEKITVEDFKPAVYAIDSSASAVVLADIGSTQIIGNSGGGFYLEFKHFKRVHILNRNGYGVASEAIYVYTNGSQEEELTSLRASTYNMEGGQIVETKLDTRNSVFKENYSKKLAVKKFTLPNIKEGSIIEYEYTLKSDFLFNLQPWEFQCEYPCLWSEYTLSLPEFYNYVTLSQGYQPFFKQEQKDKREVFSIGGSSAFSFLSNSSFTARVTDFHWVMKDVPALKEESYTSTLRNHIARIGFQLSELRAPYEPKNVMGTWQQASNDIRNRDDFGTPVYRDNGWLSDDIRTIAGQATDPMTRARAIFAFVRDRITCTDHSALWLEKSLKSVLKDKNGSVAEVNLLLTAMLVKAGLEAAPVLLSTRDHGYTYEQYPLIDRFNYVVSRVKINDNYYLLDASRPAIGFGRLPLTAYNGHARVMDSLASPVELSPDSLHETEMTTVFLINGKNGKLQGTVQNSPGYFKSYSIRNRIREKGEDQYIEDLLKSFTTDARIKNMKIDSLDNFDGNVRTQYDLEIDHGNADVLYINPMIGQGWKENPFKSAKRYYPVEMPYKMDEILSVQIDVPEGYEIDELPKQLVVKLNEDGDGMFEYRISESSGTVSLRSRLMLKRSFFHPDEYESLREFFNLVVKKHSENIVFKKKK